MKQSTFSAVMANSIKNLLQGYTKGIRFVAVLTMLLIVGIGQAWGQYTKASSIAVGDVVVLVYESGKKELSSISGYGVGTSYSGTPAGLYELTVEAGSSSGTFSLKNGSTYLSWSSGNSLATATSKNSNSSWKITFSNGNATIQNDKDNARKLQWNASSPRFACYTSSQTAVQLYKKSASYTVNWTINPAAGGILSATSGNTTTVTPNAAYTYGSPAYTVTPAGKANVSQDGDNFTATPSANCTIQINMVAKPKYTVNWYVNETIEHSQTDIAGTTLTNIPDLEDYECGGKVFVGWTTQPSYEHATDAPNDLITNTTGMTIPENGEDYYAVFAESGGTPTTSWPETDIANISSGDEVVITMTFGQTTYALPNAENTSNAPAGRIVDNIENGCIKGGTDGVNWIISIVGNELTFESSSVPGKYLYCTNANNGVRVGTNANKTFTIDASSGYLKHTGTSRYVGVYVTNPDWRCYTSTTTNIGNQTLAFYKKTTTSGYQNYTTECSTPTEFTVSFDANGHGTAPNAQIVASGQQATEPTPAPTATGYTFGGWYKESACTNKFDFNTAITERITLYAKWTAIQTTITLNANGGSGNTTSVAATYDSSTLNPSSITNPTKTGHTFGGWYSGEGGTGSLVINSSGKLQANVSGFTGTNGVWKATTNKTLYAKWTPAVYTINYKDQGGANFSGQHEAGYPQNHTYNTETTLKSASKEHYTFGGWYKENDCSGTPVTTLGATEYTDEITLYAKWTAKTYTITFNAGTGECGTEFVTTTNASGVTLPTASHTCTDWTFAGWWTESVAETTTSPGELLTAGSNYKPTSDCTLYAVYSYTEAGGGDSDVTFNFSNIATANSWTNGTAYTTVTISPITINAIGGGNNGKYYTSNTSWRMYNGGSLQISTEIGKITSVSSNPSKTFTINDEGTATLSFSATTEFKSITVSYSSTTTTYNSNPTCLVPVWEGATIDKTKLTVNCGERSPMDVANGAAKITFPAEKIYNFTKDITIEATTGFLVSTSQNVDANYKSSVSLSPLVGTANANTFYNKFVYVRAEAPAQSDTDLEGTITIKNSKGETLQTITVTADVTCTQYTLTLVDRGVSTKQPTKYYAGETINEAPADPEGVCTDPIHYVFDGWATASVAAGATTYTKVTFPYTVEGNTKFYAVYRYVEDGGADSGDYVKVTENLDDYSGDYLFVYETGNVAFDGGRNNVDDELDATSNTIEVTINDNTIASNATTDAAKFTIAKVDGGYSIQSASGYYIGWSTADKNGLNANSKYSANYYLNTISNSIISGVKGTLKFNKTSGQERFRYYQSGQEDIALYRKAASYLYTTSPICGPHLAITEGKDIYVTGGNAGGTRDLVIAQQKVSYKATRLEKDKSTGNLPSIKALPSNIVFDNTKTKAVAVTFDEDSVRTLQSDGTYTITGNITIAYQPAAANVTDDIQVTLNANYNPSADVSQASFTVHARSLPAEFVIVAKSGEKWYALNGDMNINAANPANGQVTLDDDANPTKATYAPCNAIYTFDGLPNTGDRTYVRFQGTDGAWLWASSGTNTGIQNNVLKTTPEGSNKAYNWKLYTEDNITYRFGNANSSRQLTLDGEIFGMYASGVQEFRILPYEAKCLYNYAPSNLKVTVLKGTYVTLTWDAVVGATKYQYSTDATNWTDCGTAPTATINGLIGDTEYTYYIRAYHEDAGVSQECIDYAEITFTTANCDDVPTDITYSADMNSITVSWIANAATSTVNLYSDEEAEVLVATQSVASPCTFTDLAKNTQYYVQILANGTCASPIIPVKTEDVEVDIVEWMTDGIIVDINTDETVGVTLENEVSYGSGLGSLAEDLFFSKYFEGSGSLKMIAIYNGTGKNVDLSEYRIDRGSNGDATNISKTYDLSQLGIIKQGQEIIFYSWPLTSEYSYSCSQSFLDSKVQESGLDANPRWILCDAKTHNGIEFEAMDFSGNDPLLLYKSSELIDVFGVSTEQESPASTQICSGRSDQAWSADGVTNMDYGKTTEDFPNGEIPHGVNVDDETITAYTARVIMFRKNTVVSGKNAVTKNTTTFATFAEEWEARQVCMSGDDGDLTCAAYQELGTFDYSDYYTKYESMNQDQEFDENARNDDGTVTIPIEDLYKHACSNIRVKLTNSKSEVLSDREYKVPIMITTTQGTDGQAFLALQENLATVEVDSEGNPTGNKTNLTLEQVREICKTCDVVVRDNATLTKIADDAANDHPEVHDIFVYENSSLIVPNGTNYTINNLSLRRKQDAVASVSAYPDALKLPESAAAPISLDFRLSAESWHWFTLPFDCNISEVTWIDGTPAQYNVDWFLMTYDGEKRAATQAGGCWKAYTGTTIRAGEGFILAINGNINNPAHTYELRFPMSKEVLAAEGTDKTVDVRAWGVETNIRPNHKGWNLVGNPYLAYYQRNNITNFEGLRLGQLTGPDPQTGYWEQTGDVPYVVVPVGAGWIAYEQVLASETDLLPFTAYFVQVGNDGKHESDDELSIEFDHTKLQLSATPMPASIIQRSATEVSEPIIVGVSLTNAKGESDKTSLIIDNQYTNEYEMHADFFKWFGDYYKYYTKPVVYSLGADNGKRAFNAISEDLATQPISLGMFAAQAGNYTFSLDLRSDLSKVQEVWLYDATQDKYTNLMQDSYTFNTAKTESAGRFFLSVKMAPKVSTDINNVTDGTIWATTQDHTIFVNGLLSNAQLWIYDATGKLLHTDQTQYYQHTYQVPVSGTYFVRVQNTMQTQTIKVVVE